MPYLEQSKIDFHIDLYDLAGIYKCTAPKYSMKTNTAMTMMLDDVIEGAGLYFGETNKLDKYVSSRLAMSVGSIYFHWATTFYSHEIAHKQDDYNAGYSGLGTPDIGDWKALVPAYDYDVYSLRMNGISVFRLSDIWGRIGGLNQQQLNADEYFYEAIAKKEYTYDDAVSYLFNQFADVAYQVFFPDYGDVADIPERLSLNVNDWMLVSSLSALLSFHSFESAKLIADYLLNGTRKSKVDSIFVDDVEIFPPNIALYLSSKGYVLKVDAPIAFTNGTTMFLDVASPLQDFDEPFRIGVKTHYELPVGLAGPMGITAEFNVDFNPDGLFAFMGGALVELPLTEKLSASFMSEFYYRDLLHLNVMGRAGSKMLFYNKDAEYAVQTSKTGWGDGGAAIKLVINGEF